ncbi:MAG TPA: hypothetical protein VFM05_01850 [Candidatus Saccharimonadales bacterium]|nr:hypothetical protein [Candidatus Saccharimonadales bacterium]
MQKEKRWHLSNSNLTLPAKRAFVVQLHADAKVEEGQWQGRVEHLVSFRATHFQSLEELQAFMVKMLSEPEPLESVARIAEEQ